VINDLIIQGCNDIIDMRKYYFAAVQLLLVFTFHFSALNAAVEPIKLSLSATGQSVIE